ncbi:MAG: bifunctional riboflavin kinase/FAD synthetase [Bacteroidia bacterium]
MNILHQCPENITEPTVITIGTFDGVHKGHQKILKRLEEIKHQKNLKSIVFTFYPHPRKVLDPQQNSIKILSDKEEKIQLLQPFNIDYLIFCPFTKEFANILPEKFVEYLAVHLNIKHIILGYDHRFGRDRKGDINTFLNLKNKYNYDVEQIPAETINEINISSTKIRNFLLNGNIENANQLLGYKYFLTGTVVEGKKLGTQIGIPTANIKVNDNDKLIPANGVYCGEVLLKNNVYKGAINIGTNPTTDNDNIQKIEVHIINFNENIYHQKIQISFTKKIRDEIKFSSINKLKEQILKDIQICQI